MNEKGNPKDIVQTKTTREARRLLRIIAAVTGGNMQDEAERIFQDEINRLGHGEKEGNGH